MMRIVLVALCAVVVRADMRRAAHVADCFTGTECPTPDPASAMVLAKCLTDCASAQVASGNPQDAVKCTAGQVAFTAKCSAGTGGGDDQVETTAETTPTTVETATSATTEADSDKVGIKVIESAVVGMMDIVITAEDIEFKALDTTMKTIVESKDDLRSNLFSILEDTKTELMDHSAEADRTFGEALVQSADALEAKITDGDDKLAVAVAGFQGDVEEWMASVQSEMNAFDQSIQKRLAVLDQAISKQLDDGLASAEAEIASASAKAVSAVTAAGGVGDVKIKELDASLAKYATDDAIIWAGGTKQNPSFRGKRDLKMDRTDLDLSGDYFTHSTAFFTIKKAGVYRLNWWTNMEGKSCHAHARVRIDKKCATGNNYNSFAPYYGNYWRDMHVDFTWVYKVGEKVNMQINSCGKGWNNDAKSNFLTFQYLGQTTSKPRANTVSC